MRLYHFVLVTSNGNSSILEACFHQGLCLSMLCPCCNHPCTYYHYLNNPVLCFRDSDAEDPRISEGGAEPSSGFSCDTNTQPMRGPQRNVVEAAVWTSTGIFVWGIFSIPLALSLTDLANAVGLRVYPVAFVIIPFLLLSIEVPDLLELAARRRIRHVSAAVSQVGREGLKITHTPFLIYHDTYRPL